MNASLAKAEYSLKHWEREAKDGAEKTIPAEKERDEAKREAMVAQLVAIAAGDAKARVEDDLNKDLNGLAVAEEGGRRSEAKISRLEAERLFLFLEFEVSKGEMSSLHVGASKEKEDYQKAMEVIFVYGYGCYAFKYSICCKTRENSNFRKKGKTVFSVKI